MISFPLLFPFVCVCGFIFRFFFFDLNTDHAMSEHSVIISVNSTVHSEVVLSWRKVHCGHEDDVDEAIKRKATVKMQLLTSQRHFGIRFQPRGNPNFV